jgi:hypothetical protein
MAENEANAEEEQEKEIKLKGYTIDLFLILSKSENHFFQLTCKLEFREAQQSYKVMYRRKMGD